jgi:hypothetical protein
MRTIVACPHCKSVLVVPGEYRGSTVSCASCKAFVAVPSSQQRIAQAKCVQTPASPIAPAQVKTTLPSPPTNQTILGKLVPTTPQAETAPVQVDWWERLSRGKKQPAVAFEDLRLMAQDGRLRRRDFVRRAGKRRWKRAGRIKDLWPDQSRQSAADAALLTSCGVCGGQLAKEAQQCPKCGAPRDQAELLPLRAALAGSRSASEGKDRARQTGGKVRARWRR